MAGRFSSHARVAGAAGSSAPGSPSPEGQIAGWVHLRIRSRVRDEATPPNARPFPGDQLRLVLFRGLRPHNERLVPARAFDVAPQLGQRFHIHPIAVLRVRQDATDLNLCHHRLTLLWLAKKGGLRRGACVPEVTGDAAGAAGNVWVLARAALYRQSMT
jgi:hypothetical protein